MRRSLIAAAIVAVLGLLSMGALGGLLYGAVAPVLHPWLGDLSDWHGDGVWPATIGAGMLWSLAFVAAGWLDQRLRRAGWRPWPRRVMYALVLWLGAVLVWLAAASAFPIGQGGV